MFDYLIVGAGFAGQRARRAAGARLPARRCCWWTAARTSAATPTTTTTTRASWSTSTARTSSTPTREEVFEYLSQFTDVAAVPAPGAGERRRPARAHPDQPRHHQPALRPEPHQHARSRSSSPRWPSRASRSAPPRTWSSAGSAASSTRSSSATTPASSGGSTPRSSTPSVTARVPVRTNRDDRYFTDTYQAMPLHGYTRMFETHARPPEHQDPAQHRLPRGRRGHPVRRDDLHRAGRRVLRLPLRQAAVPVARVRVRDGQPGVGRSRWR